MSCLSTRRQRCASQAMFTWRLLQSRLSTLVRQTRVWLCWRSLCTLYLHACHVTVTVGYSCLCCCTCVTYFELINSRVCWVVEPALCIWFSRMKEAHADRKVQPDCGGLVVTYISCSRVNHLFSRSTVRVRVRVRVFTFHACFCSFVGQPTIWNQGTITSTPEEHEQAVLFPCPSPSPFSVMRTP